MPRGKNLDDRLSYLGRRLDAIEAQKARVERREHTDDEIVDIVLVLMAYVPGWDVEGITEKLVQDLGVPFEDAERIAADLHQLLEERREDADNPDYPV